MIDSPTAALKKLGVSIWLDDLSKDRITTGSLATLMKSHHVVGVTSNPTIFASSVAGSTSYAVDIAKMKEAGLSPEEAVFRIMVADVQGACDLLRAEYEQSGGSDGRVSLEVSPELAHDTQGTISQAVALWGMVDRENLMIKIPATKAGLPAITEVIALGISVNVTLIFSLERYSEVLDSYFAGIDKAAKAGHEISKIHSVASFFVSRVDSAIDPLLNEIGTDKALAMRSLAAIANARLAYQLFTRRHASIKAKKLATQGMNLQRPLWASTGVKDPNLPETYYVMELAGANTVNTMPENTLRATESYGGVKGDRVQAFFDASRETMAGLEALGISMSEVTDALESAGVKQFVTSWIELLVTVSDAMEKTV